MFPILISANPLVAWDVAAFVRLLKSKGGQLGDGVISEQEALTRLTAFVMMLYAVIGGRCDFWPLMEAYQVGFGSKCYSFHGLEATLVGGPIWTRDGIQNNSAYQWIELPAIYDGIVSGDHWIAAFYKRATNGWGSVIQFDSFDAERGRYTFMDDQLGQNRRAFGATLNSTWGGMAFAEPSPLGSWNFYMFGTADYYTSLHCSQNSVKLGTLTGQNINPTGAIVTRRMNHEPNNTAPDSILGFALIDKRPFPVSRHAEIYRAFKKTLGKELSLP